MNWQEAFICGLLSVGNWDGQYTEGWDLLFDGLVTTTQGQDSDLHGAVCGSFAHPRKWFKSGDVVRLTVDGVQTELTAGNFGFGGNPYVGNYWLAQYGTSGTDSGFDFLVYIPIASRAAFYSRNAGTSHVKIEKKVT